MRKIAIITITLLVVSCSDFLKEKPTTSYMENGVFDSEESLESLTFGLYRLTLSSTASTTMFYNFGCSSRFVQWKASSTKTGRQYEQYLRGTLYADQSQGASIFRTQFSAIQSCNVVLKGLKTSPVNEDYKREIEAEARFLRAVNYFFAVRMFGDVPLFTEPRSTEADSHSKRTSFKKVYAQIVKDLDFASRYMRDEQEQLAISGPDGRANRFAAKAFLAQVYLQIASLLSSPDDQAFGTVETGYVRPDFTEMGITSAEQAYQLALDAADEVIYDGPYELEPNFATLFAWEPDASVNAYSSKERIFVMQNTPNGGSSSRFTMNTLPNYMQGTLQGETLHTCSTAGYIRPFRMVLDKWSRTHGGTRTTTAEGLEYYTDCLDPRYAATYIVDYYQTGNANGRFATPAHIQTYPLKPGTQPYFRKYFCSSYNADAACADFYILRLADIYLIAAEASAMLEKSGRNGEDAYGYIEKLHARARGELDANAVQSESPKWERGQFASKEELVNAIFWESIFETHGEGREWFNSHRQGATWLLENVYEPMHQFLMAPEQASYRSQWWYNLGFELPRTIHNTRCSLLCEYPDYEILYNRNLSQKDQNVYTSLNAIYNVTAGGNGTNEKYEDEDDNFPW